MMRQRTPCDAPPDRSRSPPMSRRCCFHHSMPGRLSTGHRQLMCRSRPCRPCSHRNIRAYDGRRLRHRSTSSSTWSAHGSLRYSRVGWLGRTEFLCRWRYLRSSCVLAQPCHPHSSQWPSRKRADEVCHWNNRHAHRCRRSSSRSKLSAHRERGLESSFHRSTFALRVKKYTLTILPLK